MTCIKYKNFQYYGFIQSQLYKMKKEAKRMPSLALHFKQKSQPFVFFSAVLSGIIHSDRLFSIQFSEYHSSKKYPLLKKDVKGIGSCPQTHCFFRYYREWNFCYVFLFSPALLFLEINKKPPNLISEMKCTNLNYFIFRIMKGCIAVKLSNIYIFFC